MKGKIANMLLVVGGIVVGGMALLLSGCAAIQTNERLSKLPFITPGTDFIPGFETPHQRRVQIEKKGAKGAETKTSAAEREILVAQLMYEYKTSPDQNMRRAAVDALAKIPHPDRDRFLREILQDDNPFVRISALEALGKTYDSGLESMATLLISQAKTDPDGDVRRTAVRVLGDISPKAPRRNDPRESAENTRLREMITLELGNLLNDRVPAVRYESMRSLQTITRKDYGHDINRWLHYIRYVRGEVPDLPSERTLAERMPTISLPMFR